MWVVLPEHAPVAIGFFVVHGIFVFHELGRALLLGQERFGLNAAFALVARAVATALAVGGLLAGYGVRAWLVAALLGEVIQAVAVFVAGARLVRGRPLASNRTLLEEGLPFWILLALRTVGAHICVPVVAIWVGLEATGFFGVATRVMDGGLMLFSTASYAIYPALARERGRLVSRRHVQGVVGLALATSVAILVGAPVVSWVVAGAGAPVMVRTIRVLAPAVGLLAVCRLIEVWMFARDRERLLAGVSLLETLLTLAALVILVPSLLLTGAALAILAGAAVRLTGLGWGMAREMRSTRARSAPDTRAG